MWKKLAITGLLLGLAVAVAQGQKAQVGAPGSGAQHPQADKRGTQESPLVVEEHPIQTDKEAAEVAARDAEHNRTDSWLTWLTLAIAIAAFLQFIGILIQAQINQRQRMAIQNSERAWLKARVPRAEFNDVLNPHLRRDETWHLVIEVLFTNHGKTPATVTGSFITSYSYETEDADAVPLVPKLPVIPVYDTANSKASLHPGSVYVPREQFALGFATVRIKLMQETNDWKAGKKCFCVYGFVQYEDVFGEKHHTNFCYVYQGTTAAGFLVDEKTGKPLTPPGFYKAGPFLYNEMT